jgi:hypothetical protein
MMRHLMRIGLVVVSLSFGAGFAHAAVTLTGSASYCENDSCMFRQWCADGTLLSNCNMNNPLYGGCITTGCALEP